MKKWNNICRICSDPASYCIFNKIPNYLHASVNESFKWEKSIDILLEETTGMKVYREDGLPQYICVLCISYLKHAVMFRDQAINNVLGLKLADSFDAIATVENGIETNSNNKKVEVITAADLVYSEDRKIDANYFNATANLDKVHKQLLNNYDQHFLQQHWNGINERCRIHDLRIPRRSDIRRKMNSAESRVVFNEANGNERCGDDLQTPSTDDNEAKHRRSAKKDNYFSYHEKNFEEDDIMDMDDLRDTITINIPESCKERKCRGCFRRFMFESSYMEHMDACIEYKFLLTIEEINRLLEIRRDKTISPHEFIRRMIFCLRKTCLWVRTNCGEQLFPGLFLSSHDSKKNKDKSSTDEVSSVGDIKSDEVIEKIAKGQKEKTHFDSLNKFDQNTSSSKFKLNDINLKTVNGNHSTEATADQQPFSITGTNNILYEIEKSQYQCKSNQSLSKTRPYIKEKEQLTLLQKLQNSADVKTTKNQESAHDNVGVSFIPITPDSCHRNLTFSARCNICNLVFVAIGELENHNATKHNQANPSQAEQKRTEEYERIIALFDESNNT